MDKNIYILLIIIILGAALRIQYLDLPCIGYHNMKENEYLSIAEEMERTGDFLNKRVYFYNGLSENPIVKTDPQIPFFCYQILIIRKFFGEGIILIRLVNIIFSLLSIFLIYKISIYFFNDKTTSLFSSFLFTILPLSVFFSRNVQPDIIGLFFMLLGILFYLRFSFSLKKINIFFASLFFIFSLLYKFNFLIGIIPCLFFLPYRYIFSSRYNIITCLFFIFLPFLFLFFYLIFFKITGGKFDFKFDPLLVFTPLYWRRYGEPIIWYLKFENYTIIFSFLSMCGLILSIFRYKNLVDRYLIGSIISVIFYCILFSNEIYQNPFIQMPFLILVCISSSYFIYFVKSELERFFKKENIFYIVIFVILVIAIPYIKNNLFRMYETIFWGVDVAGSSLAEFTERDERFFLFAHPQANAIARYAKRYAGWPTDLKDFKEKEEKYKIRFLCIYPFENIEMIKRNYKDIYGYLENNYFVKEIGLFDNPLRIIYIILEKGKIKDKSINKFLSENVALEINPATIYKLKNRLIFFYISRP